MRPRPCLIRQAAIRPAVLQMIATRHARASVLTWYRWWIQSGFNASTAGYPPLIDTLECTVLIVPFMVAHFLRRP